MLIPRLRSASLVMAGLVLAVVLACIGPFGRNYNAIVWPMNIYVVFIDVVLFYSFRDIGIGRVPRFDFGVAVAALFFTFAPTLSFFQVSPLFTSLKLYSGNVASAYVQFAPDEDMQKFPLRFLPFVREDIFRPARLDD